MSAHAASVVAAVIAAIAGTAHGQADIFWADANSGVWSNANNWTPATVPNNNQENLFNATLGQFKEGTYTVTLDIDVALENFSITGFGNALDLTDRTFTVNRNFSVDDATILRNGQAPPSTTIVGGNLSLGGSATLMNVGVIRADAGIDIGADSSVDVCNTCIDNRSDARLMSGATLLFNQGGEIINNAGASFTTANTSTSFIGGDGSGRFVNNGTFNNGSEDRGVAGLTSISGVEFFNNGTVNVIAGGLQLSSNNDLLVGNTLSGGNWNILNSTFIDFGTKNILRTLDANLRVAGQGAFVSGLFAMTDTTESARFTIEQGADFTALASFNNQGTIEVGLGSTFNAAQFGMDNFDGPGLFFGTFVVAGTFLTGQEQIDLLDADLTLLGPDSVFSGIQSLNRVGSSGSFTLDQGRIFQTQGNFIAEEGGRVVIGADSALAVNGILINNDTSGVFDAAAFEVRGVLSANNLQIRQISNELILDGVASQILDSNGNDAINSLERILSDGVLRLRNGRSLDIQNIVVEGVLSIEGAREPGILDPGTTPGTLAVAGIARLASESTLEIVINGSDDFSYGKLVAAAVEIDPDATLALVVNPGAQLVNGDAFFIVTAEQGIAGSFSHILGLEIGNGLFFEVFQDDNAIYAVVVPAPGVGALGLAFGLTTIRRRRR